MFICCSDIFIQRNIEFQVEFLYSLKKKIIVDVKMRH